MSVSRESLVDPERSGLSPGLGALRMVRDLWEETDLYYEFDEWKNVKNSTF